MPNRPSLTANPDVWLGAFAPHTHGKWPVTAQAILAGMIGASVVLNVAMVAYSRHPVMAVAIMLTYPFWGIYHSTLLNWRWGISYDFTWILITAVVSLMIPTLWFVGCSVNVGPAVKSSGVETITIDGRHIYSEKRE